MGLGRRKVGIHEASAWVFNRMAGAYAARPAYPEALVDTLVELAGVDGRVCDVGAGIGHLALPLGERRLQVTAVEPAEAMLTALRAAAEARALPVRAVHAAAEALPIAPESVDLVVVADALHFLDAELSGREMGRVLARRGALAVITCELGDTPFMRALVAVMEEAAPRRPRKTATHLAQLFKVAGVRPVFERRYLDVTPLDHERLEAILRSISFVGPAMNAERFERFSRRVRALPGQPEWARQISLQVARALR